MAGIEELQACPNCRGPVITRTARGHDVHACEKCAWIVVPPALLGAAAPPRVIQQLAAVAFGPEPGGKGVPLVCACSRPLETARVYWQEHTVAVSRCFARQAGQGLQGFQISGPGLQVEGPEGALAVAL